MASVQFTIRLDRTNDFACFKRLHDQEDSRSWKSPTSLERYYTQEIPGEIARWNDKFTFKPKIDWLMNYGTLADLEFLYRAINDITIVSKETKKGYLSADIGYLGFSSLAFELGPMHYIGFITGVSVNHLMFTQEYIPIRSDVTISANVMAHGTTSSGILSERKDDDFVGPVIVTPPVRSPREAERNG